ncbi:MAG TPA: hypothetical protein VMR80_10275 [Candidatus Acidoferrum sp.]|nr:hypothetical protein [Candidatus Acidoferrum sp.]
MPTFRFKPFRTVSIIVPSAVHRNLGRKGLSFLANHTRPTIPRQISEVSRFQQIGQLAKFFLRHIATQPLGVTVI